MCDAEKSAIEDGFDQLNEGKSIPRQKVMSVLRSRIR